MTIIRKLMFLSALMLVTAGLAVCADQAKPAAKQAAASAASPASPDEQAIRQRTKAYYDSMLKMDRPSAAQYVSPDTRAALENVKMTNLVSVQVLSVKVAPDGTGVAKVIRTFANPSFGYIDVDYDQPVKRVDGQWYVVLPDPNKVVTPFGVFDKSASASPAGAAEIIEQRRKEIDPDQVFKAMDHVEKESQGAAKPASASPAQKHTAKPNTENPKAQPQPQQ